MVEEGRGAPRRGVRVRIGVKDMYVRVRIGFS